MPQPFHPFLQEASRLRKLAIPLFLVLAILVIHYIFKEKNALPLATTMSLPPPQHCRLEQSSCTINLPTQGSITVNISPRPIPVLKPIQLQIQLNDTDTEIIDLALSGTSMDMGTQQLKLEKISPTQFTTHTTIPICATGAMEWRAAITLKQNNTTLAVPVLFTTQKN